MTDTKTYENKINVINVNCNTGEIQSYIIPRKDLLKAAYQAIDCDTVDVVNTQLNGREVSIWVDDNGRLSNTEKLLNGFVVVDEQGYQHELAGTIFLTGGADEQGETLTCPLALPDLHKLLMTNPHSGDPFIRRAHIPSL